MTQTFGINTSTGSAEGETRHIAVEVKDGRVVMTPASSNVWTETDYAAYLAAQEKKAAR